MKKEDILRLPPHIREMVVIGEMRPGEKQHVDMEMKRAEEVREKRGKMAGDAIFIQLLRDTTRLKIPYIT